MSPKPTLGYPSRTDAVVALRAQGKNDRQISDLVGIPTKTISALEASAARKRRPDGVQPTGRAVMFDQKTIDQIAPFAARRGKHPHYFIRTLVETCIAAKLVDAVLDDQ